MLDGSIAIQLNEMAGAMSEGSGSGPGQAAAVSGPVERAPGFHSAPRGPDRQVASLLMCTDYLPTG